MSSVGSSSSSFNPYSSCHKTLESCKTFTDIPAGTPLEECLEQYKLGLLKPDTTPDYFDTPLPTLSQEEKDYVTGLLNSSIPLTTALSVTPLQWFQMILKKCQEINWQYGSCQKWMMTGSTVPLPNIPLKQDWHNIDFLISVYTTERVLFEKLVIEALNDILGIHTSEYLIKITPLPPDLGTIFTFGDKNKSLDLILWYEPYHLPVLFTQNAATLLIDVFVYKATIQEPLKATTVNIPANLLLSDKRLKIIRYLPTFERGAATNLGVFTRLKVLRTKGHLQPQEGLEKGQLDVYLRGRKGVAKIAFDIFKSFQEHLPSTPGTFLAHWLHWMMATKDLKGVNRSFPAQLAFALDETNYIGKILSFLQKNGNDFLNAANVLKLVSLIGYFLKPGEDMSLGMWDGLLALRLKMESETESYFQFPFDTTEILQSAISLVLSEATRDLLTSTLEHFGIRRKFEITPYQQEKYLKDPEIDLRLFHIYCSTLYPSPPPVEPFSDPSSSSGPVIQSTEFEPSSSSKASLQLLPEPTGSTLYPSPFPVEPFSGPSSSSDPVIQSTELEASSSSKASLQPLPESTCSTLYPSLSPVEPFSGPSSSSGPVIQSTEFEASSSSKASSQPLPEPTGSTLYPSPPPVEPFSCPSSSSGPVIQSTEFEAPPPSKVSTQPLPKPTKSFSSITKATQTLKKMRNLTAIDIFKGLNTLPIDPTLSQDLFDQIAQLVESALSKPGKKRPSSEIFMHVMEALIDKVRWKAKIQASQQLGIKTLAELRKILQNSNNSEERLKAWELGKRIVTHVQRDNFLRMRLPFAPWKCDEYLRTVNGFNAAGRKHRLPNGISIRKMEPTKNEMIIALFLLTGVALVSLYLYNLIFSKLGERVSQSYPLVSRSEFQGYSVQSQWFSPNPDSIGDDPQSRLRELPKVLSGRTLDKNSDGSIKIILFETLEGHFLCETASQICRLLTPEGIERAFTMAARRCAENPVFDPNGCNF